MPIVVKVGGSLYDLPDLGTRLREWLTTLPTKEIVLVPGGGRGVDVIRELDRIHGLGEEHSHWLALRAVTVAAHFLAGILGPMARVTDLSDGPDCWRQEMLPIIDLFRFAESDEGRPGSLPHSWSVTSDSFAVRLAQVLKAEEVILLKSVSIGEDVSWEVAAGAGVVDRAMPELLDGAYQLRTKAVNAREEWIESKFLDALSIKKGSSLP